MKIIVNKFDIAELRGETVDKVLAHKVLEYPCNVVSPIIQDYFLDTQY
jgi:hypothetical protein